MSSSVSRVDRSTADVLIARLGRLRREYCLRRAARLSVGLAVAAGAGVVAGWVAGLAPPARLLLWLPGAVVLVAGTVALAGRPSLAATARLADRRFALADRAATALGEVRSDDPMAALVVEDATDRLPERWGAIRLFDRHRDLRAALLVAAIPLATALAFRTSFELLRPSGQPAGRGARATLAGNAPTESPTEAISGAAPGSEAAERADRGGDNASRPGEIATAASGSTAGSSSQPAAPPSTAGSAASREMGSGAGERAGEARAGGGGPGAGPNASASGTSSRASLATIEGSGATGALAGPAAGNANPRPGSESPAPGFAVRIDTPNTPLAGRLEDPRQRPDYEAAWRLGRSAPLTDRIPPGLGRYIRDYFNAIEP